MARPPASAEAREHRINQLLDAAVALWLTNPDRLPSVAEVAGQAGLAKGTVYLYFKSKEDMLLAAHERHVQAFFEALMARASSSEPLDINGMMNLVGQYILREPTFLPLATLVAGLKYKGITPEASQELEARIAEHLKAAGALLRNHFPLPDADSGARLLMRSYALILGLWQLVGSERPICSNPDVSAMMLPDYSSELEAALRALWFGTFNEAPRNA